MSKWLENARSVAVPIVPKVPKVETRASFGTNDTCGTRIEHRDGAVEAVAFEERAAICEYDGELPRGHADLIAAAGLVPPASGETLERREATILHFAKYLDRLRDSGRKAGVR